MLLMYDKVVAVDAENTKADVGCNKADFKNFI